MFSKCQFWRDWYHGRKKIIDYDYGDEYLRSISSKNKKNKFYFSWHLKIDKESVANVKEDQGE